MPSMIKAQHQRWINKGQTLVLTLLCSSILIACGSGDTSRAPVDDTPPAKDTEKAIINAVIPVHVTDAKVKIQLLNESKPVYSNDAFTGFEFSAENLEYSKYRNQLFLVTITGDNKSLMYDPVQNKYVPFNGTLHAINTVNGTNPTVFVTPASEAIYQRTIVRSNQFDLNKVDLALINNKHLSKSTGEINAALNFGFFTNKFPKFSTVQSISVINKENILDSEYTSLFTGLGYLQYWLTEYPNTQNTYLEFAKNFAVDLRDGYLDGRTLNGDNTPFKTIPAAPKNYDPNNNTFAKIGNTQQNTRQDFGEKWKQGSLYYAKNVAYQETYNPTGIQALEMFSYYDLMTQIDATNRYRWNGAGDYRPAFGFTSTAKCKDNPNPCKQGLNADDLETSINDIEYLIGTHQVHQCVVQFYPNGDVNIKKGDKIYRSSINRDLSDNLIQINNDPQHYILNVGASENRPSYILQFEIKDLDIVKARTGYNYNIYSTTLETPEMDCAS